MPCAFPHGRYYFNPHSPCGERPTRRAPRRRIQPYFNPHSPCGERRSVFQHASGDYIISIHTPLAGSDLQIIHTYDRYGGISIHTPLAGSDGYDGHGHDRIQRFQSTLPLRGATPRHDTARIAYKDFNPHSPCGERPCRFLLRLLVVYFNPHSPCGERPQK